MPEIEHRRHSWREPPGEHLTQKGVDLARRVGETMGRFDLVITSDSPRAFETAIAMGYAVDRQDPRLFSAAVGDEVEPPYGAGEFARALASSAHTTRECATQAAVLKEIAARLRPNGRALVVSHGGIIEAGVVGLLPGKSYEGWGPGCQRGEGVVLTFDADECVDARILRLPPGWQ